MVMKIGYHASHEQWAPSVLLQHVIRAEQAGFTAAMCSDHFNPWLPEQGQSGFTWSWLGAAMAQTQLTFGTVCAPGDRYHPAIIAQAAATLGEMFPQRFWLSVGSGEALNEHITGAPWPSKSDRNTRLKECVDIMRALWAGETVTHRGLVTVVDARLSTRPATPPQIVGAALSAETARWMGSWVDALITAGNKPEPLRKLIAAFREGGGAGKPIYLQTALAYAVSEEEARRIAHQQWRQSALDPKQLADLPSPEAFAAAAREVSVDEVANTLRVSSDIKRHIAWLEQDLELGFDCVYLHQLGPNIDEFIDVFAQRVLPVFST